MQIIFATREDKLSHGPQVEVPYELPYGKVTDG